MLPDVAHLDLVLGQVSGGVGQHAAFESLEHHVLLHPADFYLNPVRVGNRVAGHVEPVKERLLVDKIVVLVNEAAPRQEIPESTRDTVILLNLDNLAGRVVGVLREGREAVWYKPGRDVVAHLYLRADIVDPL